MVPCLFPLLLTLVVGLAVEAKVTTPDFINSLQYYSRSQLVLQERLAFSLKALLECLFLNLIYSCHVEIKVCEKTHTRLVVSNLF